MSIMKQICFIRLKFETSLSILSKSPYYFEINVIYLNYYSFPLLSSPGTHFAVRTII
jgi:hypothetical protein